MDLSTFRRFLAAMGGERKTIARFPQGDVVINPFEVISRQKPTQVSG